MAPTPLQHASLSDAAFNEIRRRIISLQIAPGQRINIHLIAQELGISPTPVREALAKLAAMKLIRVETYKGFTVEPLLDAVQLTNLSAVRRLLEVYALEVVTRSSDAKVVASLRDNVTQMEKLCKGRAFDGLVFNDMDRNFHENIIAGAKNELLLDTYKSINVHVQIARLFHQRAAKHAMAANLEHLDMIEAIERGDIKGSVTALGAHIDKGLQRLLTLVGARQGMLSPTEA